MASTAMRAVAERIRAQREAGSAEVAAADFPTRRQAMDAVAPQLAADVGREPLQIPGPAGSIAAEWLLPPGYDPDRRLLYLHGGGYTVGSLRSHRHLAAELARASGCAALIIEYRLAPEHPFPAALDDALAAYRFLRRQAPDAERGTRSSFIAGDSAGGGLTLATLLAARDAGDPLPEGAVLFSAWTDLAATGDSVRTRAGLDPMIDADALNDGGRHYYQGHRPHDPLVSPLYADLSGLPPLLLQAGDHEVLLDDSIRIAERARAAGLAVHCEIEPEAFHVYQYFVGLIPEAQAALDRAGEFMRGLG